MLIDGVAASEAIDSSGEVLSIEGMDITDCLEGKCYINFEHKSQADDLCGIVTFAKKIFSEKDCDNDRERMFWKQTKMPLLYIKARLFDDTDHPGAVALAAIMRGFKKHGEKIQMGFSVEGSTLSRKDNTLERSVIRKVSATVRPCNKQAWAEILSEDDKSDAKKSEKKYTFTEMDASDFILEDNGLTLDPVADIKKALADLNKTLTASGGNVTPSQLVGGAALAREDVSGTMYPTIKARVQAALRDWTRKRPLKETIKAALPEVSDAYIDHFTDLAEELALKKSVPVPKFTRIGAQHGPQSHDDDQKKLIEGLYVDQSKKFNPGHIEHSQNTILKLKNDAGQDVLLKMPQPTEVDSDGIPFNPKESQNAPNYYRLAKDFFGLGNHVPVTAVVAHPRVNGGADAQAVEYTEGQTPLESGEAWEKKKNDAIANGDTDKLLAMDQILGILDRHSGNIIMGKDGHIKHIDNDNAFTYPSGLPHEYAERSDIIHPGAVKWLMDKDPVKLAQQMRNLGADPNVIKKAVAALQLWKKYAAKGHSIEQIHRDVDGHLAYLGAQDAGL